VADDLKKTGVERDKAIQNCRATGTCQQWLAEVQTDSAEIGRDQRLTARVTNGVINNMPVGDSAATVTSGTSCTSAVGQLHISSEIFLRYSHGLVSFLVFLYMPFWWRFNLGK